ncbi:MAG: DNRLRE domain-containing protein [Verrucomicrobiaceae bacterium]|nr:DNRLRE domain-containing protein [Verrucomicrobiaceae bacterium]
MIRGLWFFCLASVASAATVVTIQPSSTTPNSGDAYLRAAAPASNFGNSGALVVSGSGAANTNGQFASFLKFDLATAKTAFDAAYGIGNWTLDSVQLQLTAATPNNPVFNANAAGLIFIEWLADDTWLENAVTWNGMATVVAAGNESLGSVSYNGASSGTALATLTASAGFTHDLTSDGSASFRLAAGDADVSMVVNSRNFGTAANRPALILSASAVPEPSRFIFFGTSLMCLMIRRTR